MNKLDLFFAKTCSFAYAPYKAYAYSKVERKLSSKEKNIGRFIVMAIYFPLLYMPIMALEKYFNNNNLITCSLYYLFVISMLGYGFKLASKDFQNRKEKEDADRLISVKKTTKNNELLLTMLKEKEVNSGKDKK